MRKFITFWAIALPIYAMAQSFTKEKGLREITESEYESFSMLDWETLPYFNSQGKLLDGSTIEKYFDTGSELRLFVDQNDKPKLVVLDPPTQAQTRDYLVLLNELAEEDTRNAARIGKKAPSFRGKTLTGETISSADLLGKPMVINFWFTSCAPCIQEIPALNALVKKYNANDVTFLAIASDTEKRVVNFLKRHPFNYAQLPKGSSIANDFGIRSYPTHVIIDRQGQIGYFASGFGEGSLEKLEKAITKVLRE